MKKLLLSVLISSVFSNGFVVAGDKDLNEDGFVMVKDVFQSLEQMNQRFEAHRKSYEDAVHALKLVSSTKNESVISKVENSFNILSQSRDLLVELMENLGFFTDKVETLKSESYPHLLKQEIDSLLAKVDEYWSQYEEYIQALARTKKFLSVDGISDEDMITNCEKKDHLGAQINLLLKDKDHLLNELKALESTAKAIGLRKQANLLAEEVNELQALG